VVSASVALAATQLEAIDGLIIMVLAHLACVRASLAPLTHVCWL
jgi:hypothetical protein